VRDLANAHHFDLARAREEMRLAGHPDGIDEEVTVLIGEGDVGRIYGELLQADLRRIGITVKLRPLSFAAFLQETGTRRRAQAIITGWNMDFPDPANFYDPLVHSRAIADIRSQNKAFYSNPALDELLDRARAEVDRDARRQMYAEAARIVAEDAPWAFVFVPIQLELWQPYVKGYRPHPVWSQDYRQVWLDLPRERIARGLGRPRSTFASFLLPLAGAER
jgi:ABC-type transport system substrate-binding protein